MDCSQTVNFVDYTLECFPLYGNSKNMKYFISGQQLKGSLWKFHSRRGPSQLITFPFIGRALCKVSDADCSLHSCSSLEGMFSKWSTHCCCLTHMFQELCFQTRNLVFVFPFFTVHEHLIFHPNGEVLQEESPSRNTADIDLEGIN